MFVGKFLVGFDGVGADAEDGDIFGLKLGVVVAEVASFFCAAGGVVAGVEVEDDGLAFEVAEGDLVALAVGEGEVGGSVADVYCHSVLFLLNSSWVSSLEVFYKNDIDCLTGRCGDLSLPRILEQ